METWTILYVLITTVMFAIYNVEIILWQQAKDSTKRKIYSNQWHLTGFMIRFALAVVILTVTRKLFWFLIVGIAAWPIYNIVIALLLGQKWYYLGQSNEFDKHPTLTYVGYAILILGVIISGILNI